MISKTQISKRTIKKRNPEIVEAITLAKKNNLLELAKKLSSPSSNYKDINIDELDKIDSERVLVVGKILGNGEINRKIGVAAIGYSQKAKEKLEKAGCDVKSIKMAIEKNPKMEGVKIIG